MRNKRNHLHVFQIKQLNHVREPNKQQSTTSPPIPSTTIVGMRLRWRKWWIGEIGRYTSYHRVRVPTTR
jgi:hypothetical protein